MFEICKLKDFLRVLKEEKLTKNDIIKYGDEYADQVETRKSIKDYLKKLATRIRNLDFVESSEVNPSTADRGLSNYIHIVFKHPENITKQELIDNYKYVIRFSDHDNKHPENDVDYEMGLVGKKTGNLSKLGMKFLFKKLPEIQEDIKSFEIMKYGKQKTFLLGEEENKSIKESLKLRIRESFITEKLESIGNGLYCTDYAGNIADLLINKAKAYRILYDSYFDIWCIADANSWTHDQMAKEMFASGYVEENAGSQEYISFMFDAHKWLSTYLRGYKLSDKEVYKSYGFNRLYLIGCMFIPYSEDYHKYEESSFYSVETRLTTGTLFTYDNYQLSEGGVLHNLYNSLMQKDAIVDSLENLWKSCVKQYHDDAVDYFYQEAEEYGYDEDEIQEFLEFHLADVYRG